ncbi:hypothetical protein EWM64_g912 [Hericium alpestre]|uniref:VPS37 C-terminal domain-containing protein n=1 Tax=Hericium alpestre TaxID=135208 RepID=A0A4Z0A8N8_9AGAM|nr:hypothetical protein EWM64_g912 [Hericium alpestre]
MQGTSTTVTENALAAEFPELSHLSREDLEDLLADPMYFQAIFHSLDRVKELYQGQAELGLANESIAKQNLAMQEDLYKLRAETKDAFDEAKALEARWAELEREQKEAYQATFLSSIPAHATEARYDGTGRPFRGSCVGIRSSLVL